MAKVAKLEASDLSDDLRVVAFRGTEQLCRPYRFDIHFQVAGSAVLDLANGVGSRATLTLQREEDLPFTFHGILASVQLHVQTPQWGLYRATLVPALWRLSQDRHSNAFTKITVPDLIKKILADSPLSTDDYEFKLDADYPEEELIVQYKESNLAFLDRWMEHEGLYYYFDQSGDREKLVIVDHRSFHDKLIDKNIRYRPTDESDVSAGESYDTFAAMHNATVERVRLTDYDYARPALDVSGDSDVSDRGVGEVCLYGSRFFDPDVAKRYARLRAEQLRAQEVTFHAAGSALHTSAGYHVELEDHPADAFNHRYLVTEVHHFCNQLGQGLGGSLSRWIKLEHEEVYRVEAKAIDSELQYRPPLDAPTPRIWGYENGVVDGEMDSPYAQIDDQGRYKVKFQFDESDLREGKASTYVRMMQPHGGGTEGFHFPLRKGTEVIFTFLGGDPDRPVITGVVPNATTPSPVTDANHTKNILRTGSGSHMTIDDAAGKEYIHLHSPKLTEMFMGGPTDQHAEEHTNKQFFSPPTAKSSGDHPLTSVSCTWYTYTDGTAGFFVDGDWWQDVGTNISIHGGGTLTEYYKGAHVLNIDGSSKQWYNDHLKVEVASSEDRDVTGTWDLKVTDTAKLEAPHYDFDATADLDVNTPKGTLHFTSEATCNFGKTALNFGKTEVDWDATSGKIKSIDIRSDDIKFTTPKWEVKDPNKSEYSFLWEHTGTIFQWTAAKKLELCVLATAITAVKMEAVGMTMANEGMNLGTVATKVRTEGLKAMGGALKSELKGLYTLA